MVNRDTTLLTNETDMQDNSDTISNPIPQILPEYLPDSTDTPKIENKTVKSNSTLFYIIGAVVVIALIFIVSSYPLH